VFLNIGPLLSELALRALVHARPPLGLQPEDGEPVSSIYFTAEDAENAEKSRISISDFLKPLR
jgi:hypothetical protein